MTEILLFMLAVTGIITLVMRNMLASVIMLAVFSLLCSLLFFILHAPDVALTEAAVGAGVSTFLFIWIIKRTERSSKT